MIPSPHFVCLSMIVSCRAWSDPPHLSVMDCLAYAIERENEPEPMPPLVERSIAICQCAVRRISIGGGE